LDIEWWVSDYVKKCELCDSEDIIREYDHWKLGVSYAQPTLGKLIAVSRRHVTDIDELTTEEYGEYQNVYRDACRLLRNVFGADRINFAYMNNNPNDDSRHVHYHIIGRYEEPRRFAGKTWVDENYGKQTPFDCSRENQEIIDKIVELYKEELKCWE